VAGRQGGTGPRTRRGSPQDASDRLQGPPERPPLGAGDRRGRGRDPGAFWREFLRGLRARGLTGVRLCISDAHQGLKAAIAQVLGCPWQRCSVHFLRDMLGHVHKTQQPMIAAAIPGFFEATSLAEARARLVEVVDKLAMTAPRSQRCWRPPRPSCWPSTSFQRALVQAQEHQPAGARQPRDRPAHRRGGHLPQ
jgi:transposase-like protein